MQDEKATRILLIEDDSDYVELVGESIVEYPQLKVVLEHEPRLESGLKHLDKERIDIVLLDLSLPDSQGINTFSAVHSEHPATPIIVLTGMDDQDLALKALSEGAQDYLIKQGLDTRQLLRAITYAIARQQLVSNLLSLSFYDELTGAYNRRGFVILSQQELKLAIRAKSERALFFADVDGMKDINDRYGHAEGDLALKAITRVLKGTFRDSDIIGRIGGDEFAVLPVGAKAETCDIYLARLEKNLDTFNTSQRHPYRLSISTGLTVFDPERPCSIEELLDEADQAMYAQKRQRKLNS